MYLYKNVKTVKSFINHNYKRQIAFTLAEILMTLLIIGIIASVVIPALINDTQEAEFHTAWKHDYAVISQIMNKLMIDTGSDLSSYLNTSGTLCLALKPYLNYTKSCIYPDKNCWNDINNFKELDNSAPYPSYFDDGGFILSNGHLITFENNRNPAITVIWVDVNGFKAPNIIGKDIYGIKVYQNGVKPLGAQGDGYENTCAANNSGWGCSAKYLMQ